MTGSDWGVMDEGTTVGGKEVIRVIAMFLVCFIYLNQEAEERHDWGEGQEVSVCVHGD